MDVHNQAEQGQLSPLSKESIEPQLQNLRTHELVDRAIERYRAVQAERSEAKDPLKVSSTAELFAKVSSLLKTPQFHSRLVDITKRALRAEPESSAAVSILASAFIRLNDLYENARYSDVHWKFDPWQKAGSLFSELSQRSQVKNDGLSVAARFFKLGVEAIEEERWAKILDSQQFHSLRVLGELSLAAGNLELGMKAFERLSTFAHKLDFYELQLSLLKMLQGDCESGYRFAFRASEERPNAKSLGFAALNLHLNGETEEARRLTGAVRTHENSFFAEDLDNYLAIVSGEEGLVPEDLHERSRNACLVKTLAYLHAERWEDALDYIDTTNLVTRTHAVGLCWLEYFAAQNVNFDSRYNFEQQVEEQEGLLRSDRELLFAYYDDQSPLSFKELQAVVEWSLVRDCCAHYMRIPISALDVIDFPLVLERYDND